ncbi:hypothetical protein BGX20_008651 [Mortierella sp. AD010]|nr:hypothetical protein BGX20_008651 [Mortierella sp. AD010]
MPLLNESHECRNTEGEGEQTENQLKHVVSPSDVAQVKGWVVVRRISSLSRLGDFKYAENQIREGRYRRKGDGEPVGWSIFMMVVHPDDDEIKDSDACKMLEVVFVQFHVFEAQAQWEMHEN